MKKTLLVLCMLSAVLFFSSCSNQVFPVMTMEMNYAMRADTKAEREIKAKVKIYYSEADVPGKYEVLSLNQYAPWFAIPIIYSGKSQIEKKISLQRNKNRIQRGCKRNNCAYTESLSGHQYSWI